jgi:tetratricopeptide (TPR) repeat protein
VNDPLPSADPDRTALRNPTADSAATVDATADATGGAAGAIGRLADSTDGTADTARRSAATPDAPTIPGYRITGEIARGGMGRVFAAIDLTLDREVAIKTLLAGAHAERFVTESKITAKLPHPGIPPVHALGTLPDGTPFLAMKLIRGTTLSEQLKARPTPRHDLPRFVGVFEQIAQAVGFAHSRGVIHRDLKPLNVMAGEFGEVQVMDWGLARTLAPAGRAGVREDPVGGHNRVLTDPGSPELTAAGAVLGTPGYMAPEQARGEMVDPRADVFALGSILAVILTGKPAFVGSTVAETVKKAANADLSDVFGRLDSCGADAELIALAKRCLSTDSAARPTDGRSVAGDVSAYRAGVEARLRQSETERAEAVVREGEQRKRRRVMQWAAAAVTGVLTLGVAGTTAGLVVAVDRANKEEQAKIAEGVAKGAEERAKVAALKDRDDQKMAYAKTADVLDVMVSDVTGDSLATQKAVSPQQRRFLEEVLTYYQEFASAAGTDEQTRVRTARAAHRVGLIEFQLGRRTQAVAAFDRARGEYAELAADFPLTSAYRAGLARTHVNLGALASELGKCAEAEAQYRKGVTLFERATAEAPQVPGDHADLARAYKNLGVVRQGYGRHDESEDLHRKSVAVLERLTADFPAVPAYRGDLATGYAYLGSVLKDSGQRAEAEGLYRKGLAMVEKLAAEHPEEPEHRADLAGVQAGLGALLRDAGKSGEAEKLLRLGLAGQQKLAAEYPTLPDYRRDLATTHLNLGMSLAARGQGAEAEGQLQAGMDLLVKLVADFPDVPAHRATLAKFHTHVGLLRAKSSEQAEAEEPFRQALAIWERLTTEFPDTPEYRATRAGVHNNLGLLMRNLGKRAEADAEHHKCLVQREKLAADFPDVLGFRLSLGGSYCNYGVLVRDTAPAAESLDWFGKAIDTLGPVHAADPRAASARQFLRNSYGGRAEVFGRLGKHAEAAADWEKAVELSSPADQPLVRALRATSRLRAGKVAEAVAEVAELRPLTGWAAGQLYDFACVYSVASGRIADKKGEYADRAVELLRKAVKAGWKDVAKLATDDDLSPLRERDDFKQLLAELEKKFPPKPEVLPPPRAEK